MDSENNFGWKQCLDVCSHPELWDISSSLNHPHYQVSFKVFIQLQFSLLHLVTFASRPFPLQPSEGGFMLSVPTSRQHLAPLPPTWGSSASVSSHMPQPSNYLGGSVPSVFPVLECKLTLFHMSPPGANKRLNGSSWFAHCASMNTMWFAVIAAPVKSHCDLCSIWYPPGLQGVSAHTCVASPALLHRVALLFHRYLTICCVL